MILSARGSRFLTDFANRKIAKYGGDATEDSDHHLAVSPIGLLARLKKGNNKTERREAQRIYTKYLFHHDSLKTLYKKRLPN